MLDSNIGLEMMGSEGRKEHGDAAIRQPVMGASRGKSVAALLRAGLVVIGTSAFIYAAGFAIFASYVATLRTPADPPHADAIIVLTGGHLRLNAAVELLEARKGRRLLISGVNSETGMGALRAATGAADELFDCCIDVDQAALDTTGNATESAKWMKLHGFTSAIVVTNNYHMPRSLLEMRRHAGETRLIPYAIVHTRLDGGGWLIEPEALRVLFTEYAKYVAALARGIQS